MEERLERLFIRYLVSSLTIIHHLTTDNPQDNELTKNLFITVRTNPKIEL